VNYIYIFFINDKSEWLNFKITAKQFGFSLNVIEIYLFTKLT